MSEKPRLRILVIAEAANPEWVSVPLVGWSIANELRSVADVHIVTQVRNRDAILRAGLIEGKDFTAIDTEALMKPLWALLPFLGGTSGKAWTIVTALQSLAYPHFERLVWRTFGERIGNREFDVVHRVTPLTPTAPSLLAGRCARKNVPFILGPLNGGVPWPKGFNRERHKEREWLSYIRSIYKILPSVRSTWRDSTAIVVGSRHTLSELPLQARAKSIFIPENAINPKRFSAKTDPSRYDGLNLCFIGRLVPYKCPDIAIEAAAELLRSGRAHLTIVGDGPMMAGLHEQVARLEISHAVTFAGWVEHNEIPKVVNNCSIFLFPSVREFGGGAVIEAMALGLVPLVVNYGGPGEIVTDATGFRVPIGPRRAIVANVVTILAGLANDQQELSTLAANGLERVQRLYTWEKKALQLCEIYDWVRGQRKELPHFPF
jgi:glycosyltransferase involved in cell wall biosynthesis